MLLPQRPKSCNVYHHLSEQVTTMVKSVMEFSAEQTQTRPVCLWVLRKTHRKKSSRCQGHRRRMATPRSDLKTPNYFNFSSFFGDFCLIFFGILL